jgi:hypothetical protein
MNATGFRRLALSLPQSSESAHMGHPDFRVRGKIFATLWPDETWGVVKLAPEQQEQFIQKHPSAFIPVKGGWGRRGATQVKLSAVRVATLKRALVAAWRNIAPESLLRESDD